jgi:hypothetical protein
MSTAASFAADSPLLLLPIMPCTATAAVRSAAVIITCCCRSVGHPTLSLATAPVRTAWTADIVSRILHSMKSRAQQQGQDADHMRSLPTSIVPDSLTGLLALDGNAHCMDCRRPHPDWLSMHFGILVCLECAGRHRSFGTHITAVRSLRLDALSPEQLPYISFGGNARFTEYVESLGLVSTSINYSAPRVLYYRYIRIIVADCG